MSYQQFKNKKRALYVDQIKALMVALVIAVHVVPMAFTSGWMSVRVPLEGSADPFFGFVSSFFFLFVQHFLYVYVVSAFGILCAAFSS